MRDLWHKWLQTVWQFYLNCQGRWPLFTVLGIFVGGIMFWGGLNTAMDLTNREAFCISCHEMRNFVYEEYKKTIHYNNRTGVRATCPDCHVPRDWVHMFTRKLGATNELFFKLVGSINTREKFEAKRLQLAQHVWRDMEDSDSRECRNCHGFDYMALAIQKTTSQRAHKRAQHQQLTCINCHMGIAHKMSLQYDRDGVLHEAFRKTKRACADCHTGMAQPPEEW